jgi:hypothetical protein
MEWMVGLAQTVGAPPSSNAEDVHELRLRLDQSV